MSINSDVFDPWGYKMIKKLAEVMGERDALAARLARIEAIAWNTDLTPYQRWEAIDNELHRQRAADK